MKIILIIDLNPFFQSSASSNRLRTLIEGLSNQGVDIELLIIGGYNNPHEFSQFGRNGSFHAIKYHYIVFLFHHNIWLRRLNKYVLKYLIRPLVTFRVKLHIKKHETTLIWTDCSYDSFKLLVSLKRKYSELSFFLELSEFLDIHLINKGNVLQRKIGDARQALFESESYYALDGLALMTKNLCRHYETFPKPGPKLLHLPMTVDLKRFDHEIETLQDFKKPYISFVGVMDDTKDGVSILIESFSKISVDFPQYTLYLIGGWNYDTPKHQKLIKKLKLETKVFWKGEFNRDQIPSIVKNASLLALPRPDSKQAQGGFPTKLGEYLATGNPVCATTVGEIPDYLVNGESVYFAEPGSVESFAAAMKRALDNPEESRRIGVNGRKVAEMYFNMDVQAKILYDFIKDELVKAK
jgi:glycosyltransferase involved in cell wall biosynthesis